MSKRPKPGSDKPHPDPNQNGGKEQQRKISGEIHVRGEIEANVPAGLIEKYKAARQENTPRDNWRFFVEVATLVFIMIYAGLTAWQANIAQKQFTLTSDQFAMNQRPWIQIDTDIGIYQTPLWVGNDSAGKPIIRQPRELMSDPNQLIVPNLSTKFTATFHNMGHSPALHEVHSTQADFVPYHGTRASGMTDVPIPELKECKPDAIRAKSEIVIFQDKPYRLGFSPIIAMPNDVDEWLHLKRVLFAQGCIKYDDEFGKPHQTNFCSYLNLGEFPHAWQTCGMGNSAW